MSVNDAEYEVIIVRHGTRQSTRSEVYLNYGFYGEPDAPFVVDYYLWVIRNDSRTVLVDTGYAAAVARRRGREVVLDPATAYRELGVDVTEPVDLVVTHAHWDHIGNLGLFPAATIVMAEAERRFWHTEHSKKPMLGHFAERAEIDQLQQIEADGRIRTFEGHLELAPGIELIEVGGHTPGQIMVSVATSEGRVLLASDVVHFREELEREMPFVSVADLPAMYEGFGTVKRMVDSGHVAIVVPGHDSDVLAVAEPLGGMLAGNAGVIGRLP